MSEKAVECGEQAVVDDSYLNDCDDLYKDGIIYDAEEVTEEGGNNGVVVPNFADALVQAKESVVYFYDNRFEEAFKICSKYETGSLPHSHGKALLSFMFALLTLEPPEIEKARRAIDVDLALCQSRRKQNSVTQSLSNLIWRPTYDDYTDEEVHAELSCAEAQCMSALLTFFSDQSIVQMFKGAYQLTMANSTFKACSDILNHKKVWEYEIHRKEFECGVRTGVGIFNLVVAHLPSKIMKILSFAGFTGDKQVGLQELNAAIEFKDSVRYEYCAMAIMGYNLYAANILGAGQGDLKWAERLCTESLAAHPKSIFFKFLKARLLLVVGKPYDAIDIFTECINMQCDWKPLNNICYWDMCWCYAITGNWQEAANCAKLLSAQCKWSPATNMYQYSVFLHHIMEEEKREDLKEQIDEAMEKVPQLKIRYAGKTIPPEKFATENALKYIKNGEKLVVPAYELFYVWNIFATTAGSEELLNPILTRIIEKENEYKGDKEKEDKLDTYCKIYLLKGVCLKYLGRYSEALSCFKEIVENETRVANGSYIPPHACVELGLTYWKLGDMTEAKRWLEKAMNDYSGYLIEALVHLRAHSALKRINERDT